MFLLARGTAAETVLDGGRNASGSSVAGMLPSDGPGCGMLELRGPEPAPRPEGWEGMSSSYGASDAASIVLMVGSCGAAGSEPGELELCAAGPVAMPAILRSKVSSSSTFIRL
jgi:hypothetical protein